MADNNVTDVLGAFEILSDEIENEIDLAAQMIAKASEARDFARIGELSDRAGAMQRFQEKLATLQEDWVALSVEYKEEEEPVVTERRNLGRLKRGMRTRHDFFYVPILKIIDDGGGSGKAGDIIDQVEPLMRSNLKDVDYEPLPSNPKLPRWKHTGYWAGHFLRKDGLFKKNAPRGVWEISDKGRQFLAEQGG